MLTTKIDLGVQTQDQTLLNSKIKDGEITGAKINANAAIDISKLNTTNAEFDSSGALKPGVVTDAKVAAGANIAINKLNTAAAAFDSSGTLKAGVVSNTEVAANAGIVYSKLNLSGSIVDADVAASAAIATAKLADGTNIIMRSGSVAFTGNQSMGAHRLTDLANGQLSQDAVTKAQLDNVTSMVNTFEWQPSVNSATLLTPPPAPAVGDRYLINGIGTGAWLGKDLNIAQWDGSAWQFTAPTLGTFVSSDAESNKLYLFTGATWDSKYFESTTASTGLTKVGFDIQIAPTAAGAGLTFDNAGILNVGGGNGIIISDNGVAVDAGVAANKIVQLTGAGIFPAIDGSQLFNINASNLSSGTLSVDRLPVDGYAGTYVNVTGDSMSGDLNIKDAGQTTVIQLSASGKVTTNNLQVNNGQIASGNIFVCDSSGTGAWTLPSTLSVGNADTVDSLHASSFLRSDSGSSVQSGNTLTISSGATLGISGSLALNGTSVTATAPELNILHLATVTTQELNDLGTIVVRETPATAPDGLTTDFPLAHAPLMAGGATCEEVYLNGILQDSGDQNDYTLVNGNVVRFVTAPTATDKVRVSYRY
jgi:hypothetical protein